MAKTKQRTKLVVHQGALGDWIVTLPLLRALSVGDETNPTVAVTQWSKAQLAAQLVPGVQAMDIEQREFTRLFSPQGPAAMGPFFEEMLASASLVVSFVSDGQDAWADNVRRLAPDAQHLFAFPRPPVDWTDTVHAWHRRELAEQGFVLPASMEVGAVTQEGPVVIHPGSGGREKRWPAERYMMLADALVRQGHDVVAVLGETELSRWPTQRLNQWNDHLRAKTCKTLDELTAILRGASLVIGNDSGPTHLAAQMGLTTLALFGPTDPRVWRPIGPQVRVVAPPNGTLTDDMTWLSLEEVLDAVANGVEA